MRCRACSGTLLAIAAALPILGGAMAPRSAAAQQPDLDAVAGWTALDVVTGYETRSAPRMAEALAGWEADRWGNLVLTVGSGAPRRVVACALDRPGYAVTQITDDGYLRLHGIGRGSRHDLWDQAHEAQQVRVLTEAGPVAGATARSNGHFSFQHRNDTAVVTADDLWVDVGARSAAEVEAMGIRLLDPVTRHLPPWTYAGEVAGPRAGGRAGCAAVATVAAAARAGRAPAGETRFVLSAQEVFGWVGLTSLVTRGGAVDEVVLVAPGEEEAAMERRPASEMGREGDALAAAGLDGVTWIAPGVRDPGALMERIDAASASALLAAVAEAAGVELPPATDWTEAPPLRPFTASSHDPDLAPVASVLTDLVELHAVPGHEWAVRRYVLEALPAWARERAVVDDMGNIQVAVGPDRDTTVFMAHLDEVGYRVRSIAPDGVVTLDRSGGAVSSAWEGQTALLHFDPAGAPSSATGSGRDTSERWKERSLAAEAPEPLRGVFLTRDDADVKDPPGRLRAWFGLDSASLAARGVRVGAGVTSYKEGLRIGPTRFTARALDDRAGTTALILAVRQIDPDALPSKVIFTWSVHEEGGLVGAAALARRLAPAARRIYSVDTFVSSDTPLESPHFAYAPLGAGPVLRAIENSSVSPPAERRRVERIAREAGIPLQTGLTQGGTDGTTFTFYGAPNQGLSWPGRYSHSPAEVLDLRDLARLRDLIVAVARAGG